MNDIINQNNGVLGIDERYGIVQLTENLLIEARSNIGLKKP